MTTATTTPDPERSSSAGPPSRPHHRHPRAPLRALNLKMEPEGQRFAGQLDRKARKLAEVGGGLDHQLVAHQIEAQRQRLVHQPARRPAGRRSAARIRSRRSTTARRRWLATRSACRCAAVPASRRSADSATAARRRGAASSFVIA